MLHSNRRRGVRASSASAFKPSLFEQLESRRLLCAMHVQHGEVAELRPDLVGAPSRTLTTNAVADPADIVWTNRGLASDGFAATFGTSANLARGVVDAVIVSYERMIGSFDYSLAGQTYSLNLSMSGGGFGAGANLNTSLGGKPKSGTITMGTGNNDGNANSTNGWFMDPTPFDNSEFAGTIVNAFSGDAQGGSPAAGIGDFFTVVAAEMTHAMGLFGNALAGWSSRTTNTGIADNASPPGFFWVFQGASIRHLMTSDNGGFQDFGSAVHSAEGPGANINFGGFNYIGAHDQGNPFYENGRRYLINETFSLMFKDAYGYLVNPAARFGSMYAIYNETTDVVTVRGGTGVNVDNISITRSGNIISVSVNPTTDVAGTGALSGAGDLPAWVTQFDVTTQPITSINVASGSGNDTITIGANVGVPISVDSGTDTDSVTFEGTAAADTMTATNTGFSSGATTVTLTGVESVAMNGLDGADTLNVNSTAGSRPLTVNGGNQDDTITLNGLTPSSYGSAVTVDGGAGTLDVFAINDAALAGTSSYTVNPTTLAKSLAIPTITYAAFEEMSIAAETGANTINVLSPAPGMPVTIVQSPGLDTVVVNGDNAGTAIAQFKSTMQLASLSVGAGGVANMLQNGNRVLSTLLLSVNATGKIDLFDNDMLVTPGTLATVQALLNQGRNGGLWNGNGITSTTAGANAQDNTTLGAMTGADYLLVNGPTFDGQAVVAGAVVVKYTYYGDTDFNGQVNFDDYSRTDAGFNGSRTGWVNGDFDGNGNVNFDDYSLIDLAFNTQGPALINLLPGKGVKGAKFGGNALR